MKALQFSMSTPLILAEAARIVGGRVVRVYHNACPSFSGGRCTCATVEYRIVRLEGKQR